MIDTEERPEAVLKAIRRRDFIKKAAAGTAITALGGAVYVLVKHVGRCRYKDVPRDEWPRIPPGQEVIKLLKPMGGQPGDPNPRNWSLRVHGLVERELNIGFEELLAMPQTHQRSDVHCVTGWSVLDSEWHGVQLSHIAQLAGVPNRARHVIFEAAHGYTANVPIAEALKPNVLIAHRLYDVPLLRKHGGPVRSLVPELYFWKSAKWLTGVRFVEEDEPGFWENRGYHNHGNPWCEERYG